MDDIELIEKCKICVKTAGFMDGLQAVAPALGGALLGAGTGALVHSAIQPESERFTPAAALTGALGGAIGGAIGNGLKPNPLLGTALGAAGFGGLGGLLTPNMTQRWLMEKKDMDDIDRTLESPYLDPAERQMLMDQKEALLEEWQEDQMYR